MASFLYTKWKNKLLQNNANSALNSAEGATGVFAALIDTNTYTPSQDVHEFYSEITGIVADNVEILTKTQLASVFDGADVTFPTVTGATTESLVLYRKNTGANTTWPVIAFIDQTEVTGLPATPNGGDITVQWSASGIFKL